MRAAALAGLLLSFPATAETLVLSVTTPHRRSGEAAYRERGLLP
jgi:hypothetical protein|tara:strand:- start:12 stop:143 length:132 start_codon:yes stop_codon:yes gene_type:complete